MSEAFLLLIGFIQQISRRLYDISVKFYAIIQNLRFGSIYTVNSQQKIGIFAEIFSLIAIVVLMDNKKIIIAIDGYSSTGKSSFAKLIAARLGYVYVDTGALYRAVTFFAWTNGFIDSRNRVDRAGLKKNLNNIKIYFRTGEDGKSDVYLNGNNLRDSIRTMEISKRVSVIAALPFVREYVDTILRRYGVEKGVVMDGRDIGTAVFPNAELKIFMTASPKVRAARRFNELKESGREESIEEILENLWERDRLDENREMNPLTRAKDALLLDNSNLTIEQELNWIADLLKSHFGIIMNR